MKWIWSRLVNGFQWWKLGLTKPMSMLAARIDVWVWFAILVSTLIAMTVGVVDQHWPAVWVNAGFGLLQGTALRWSLHGLMYRKEIRAEQEERDAFLEIIKGGYGIKDQPRKKKRRT